MEKRTKNKITVPRKPAKWGLKEMERDLLASGAVEITREMQKKEPYKSIIKKIKYDLAHEV